MKTPKVEVNIPKNKEPELTPFQKEIEKVKKVTEQRMEALKPLHGTVYPLVFVRPATEEIFVGFIKEPTRAAKMQAFDIMSTKESLTLAGEVILTSSLIPEESHEAFSSLDSKFDDVYMGGCIDAMGHIKVLMNSLKKK